MHCLIELIVNKQQFRRGENILCLHTGGNVGLLGCMARMDRFLARETHGRLRTADVDGNAR